MLIYTNDEVFRISAFEWSLRSFILLTSAEKKAFSVRDIFWILAKKIRTKIELSRKVTSSVTLINFTAALKLSERYDNRYLQLNWINSILPKVLSHALSKI